MTVSLPLIGAGILQAVVYLLFIRAVDLYERESFLYVIPVFVWGFTVAVAFALVVNTLASIIIASAIGRQPASVVTAVFVAPVVEESIKGTALLITFVVAFLVSRRRGAMEFSGVMDGIVYGSAVGFGFSIAEDLLYYLQFGPETFIVRRLFGGFAHAAFTSLTGVGFGLIPWVRNRFAKVALPIAGLIGAMFLHATFNIAGSIFGPLAYLVELFVVILYIVVICVWLAVERRTIRSELEDEMRSGVITAYEYSILPTYFRRTGHYLGLILTGHLITWRRERKAHAIAVDLALTKRISRNSRDDYHEARLQDMRRRIASLKGEPLSNPTL